MCNLKSRNLRAEEEKALLKMEMRAVLQNLEARHASLEELLLTNIASGLKITILQRIQSNTYLYFRARRLFSDHAPSLPDVPHALTAYNIRDIVDKLVSESRPLTDDDGEFSDIGGFSDDDL